MPEPIQAGMAYLVCKVEDKTGSVFIQSVPEAHADWLADGLRNIPGLFNVVAVIKAPETPV